MIDEEYVSRITEKAPITFYMSANDGGRIHLPGRMQPVHEASERYIGMADNYIIDSSFNRKDITNIDVLDKAVEVGASQIMLEDVYMNFGATVEKVAEGIDMAKEHEYDGRVICPLQEPYVECWERIGRPGDVAIGGLKDGSDEDRIQAAKDLRRAGGSSLRIHGLGWGLTDRIIAELRYNPDLLDSVDSRTPHHEGQKAEVWERGTSHKSEVSTVYSIHMYGHIMEKLRRTVPELSEDPNGAMVRGCENCNDEYYTDEMDEIHEHVTTTLSRDLCENCARTVALEAGGKL